MVLWPSRNSYLDPHTRFSFKIIPALTRQRRDLTSEPRRGSGAARAGIWARTISASTNRLLYWKDGLLALLAGQGGDELQEGSI
jgi:hypothetical protein